VRIGRTRTNQRPPAKPPPVQPLPTLNPALDPPPPEPPPKPLEQVKPPPKPPPLTSTTFSPTFCSSNSIETTTSEQPFSFLNNFNCLCNLQSCIYSNALPTHDVQLPSNMPDVLVLDTTATSYSLQLSPTLAGSAVTDSGASLIFLNSHSPFIIPGTKKPLPTSFRIHQGTTTETASITAIASFTFQDRRDPSTGIVLTAQAILLDNFRPDLVLLSHSICHFHNVAFMIMPPPHQPYGFVVNDSPTVPKDPDDLPDEVKSFDCLPNSGGTYDVKLYEPNSFSQLHSATTNAPFVLADDIRVIQHDLLPNGVFKDLAPESLQLPKLPTFVPPTPSQPEDTPSNYTSLSTILEEPTDADAYLLDVSSNDYLIANANTLTDDQLLSACTTLADSIYDRHHEALVTFTNKLRQRVDIPTCPPTSTNTNESSSSAPTPDASSSTSDPSSSVPTHAQPHRPLQVPYKVTKDKYPSLPKYCDLLATNIVNSKL